jgi:CRISPR/Cas system-associated endoribonuclease Cas2
MATFTVSYDLIKNKDYKGLCDELTRLGGHRAQLSYWLLNVNVESARDLRDHLKGFVDDDDSLFISELTKNNAPLLCRPGTNNWLKANPPAR